MARDSNVYLQTNQLLFTFIHFILFSRRTLKNEFIIPIKIYYIIRHFYVFLGKNGLDLIEFGSFLIFFNPVRDER